MFLKSILMVSLLRIILHNLKLVCSSIYTIADQSYYHKYEIQKVDSEKETK